MTAHNITNVNTEGYSRQRAEISARSPVTYSFGELGRGVQIDSVERVRDQFLDSVYRAQLPSLESSTVQSGYYTRIENLFQEPGENGFGTRLNEFFDVLNTYSTNVESLPAREAVIAQAQTLASNLNEMARRLDDLQTDANEQILDLVPEINSITERIAALNENIRSVEGGTGQTSSGMRDERDVLLDKLAGYVNISTREGEDGQVSVLLGDQELVSGTGAHALEAVRNATLDPDRTDLVDVRFVETKEQAAISNGELYGALVMRDTAIPTVSARLDTIASSIIQEMNSIQSQGHGLKALSGNVLAANAVTSAAAPLTSAGLPFAVKSGQFSVIVYDSTGNATTTTVSVSASMSLNSVVAQLQSIPGLSAQMVGGTTLRVTPATGNTVAFASDTSGLLTALGMNGLFTGHDAATIGVSDTIASNPSLLTSGYGANIANTGDNQAALDMAGLRNTLVLENDTASINDYYQSLIARLGIDSQASKQAVTVESGYVQDFQSRRQEVSGVSIDEEVTSMIQFQRAFESSARVISVVDRMLETLINTVG